MASKTTDDIKSRINIIDLVKEYIELKPAGAYHKAVCPFHNEKTPSFMVSPERQIYHCFGCGEHGDIFTFVEKMEGVEFPEALRLLAKKAGVEIKNEDPRLRNERTKLQDILKFAGRVYQEYLRKAPESHPVKQYVKKRNISDEIIEMFQIGFAPDNWDSLSGILAKKNIRSVDAQAAGLLVRKDDGTGFYDRFRARLMFPIHDANGTIVGFGGRVIPTLEAKCLGKDAAKYINTPQSPVYNKSNVLYGLHLAKNAIRQKKQIVVVEGYMDCIAAHKVGTTHVVASSGTAFTEGQAKLLKRFTSNVLVAYDMDEAGVAAAARGVAVLLQEGITVRVVELPDNKDPDDVITENPATWKSALDHPKLFLDFAFARSSKGKDMSDVEQKKAIASELLPLVVSIGNPIEKSHYIQKLADMLGVEESVVRESLSKIKSTKTSTSPDAPIQSAPGQHPFTELLAIVVRNPEFFSVVNEHLAEEAISDPELRKLYSFLRIQYNHNKNITFEEVRERLLKGGEFPQALKALDIAELASTRLPEHADHIGQHIIQRMMEEHLKSQLHDISEKIKKAEQLQDSDELQKLAEHFEQVMQKLRQFTSQF